MATKVVRIGGAIIKAQNNEWLLKYKAYINGETMEAVEKYKTRREAIQAAFDSATI